MLRLLIVEDDGRLRDLFSRLLKLKGHQVREAQDGQEAVQVASQEVFDLVVMDIKMPKLDGISAFHKIRSATPSTPIMLITGYQVTPDLEALLGKGTVEYLRKPFTFDHFMEAIDRMTHHNVSANGAESSQAKVEDA